MPEKITCSVNITLIEWNRLKKQEAVVIEEYADINENRFGKIVGYGSLEEMRIKAKENKIIILLNNVKCIGAFYVLVKDLIGPSEK